jgi:hypothetical protein
MDTLPAEQGAPLWQAVHAQAIAFKAIELDLRWQSTRAV